MSLTTNRAALAQALSQLFNNKGRTQLVLDETVVPIVSLGDVTQLPYLRYGIPVGRGSFTAAAVALAAFNVARPGPTKVLQIRKIIIQNASGVLGSYEIRILTAADLALITLGGVVQFLDLSNPISKTFTSSTITSATNATAAIGARLAVVNCPNDDHRVIDFPDPGIALFGDDEGGRGGLSVANQNLNFSQSVCFYGREFPLPGQ